MQAIRSENLDVKLEANRELCRQLKRKVGCIICGEKDPTVLEFHHLDPKYKDFAVSQWRGDRETLQAEIDKCVCVCANHHKQIHAEVIALPPRKMCKFYKLEYVLPPTANL